MLPINLLQSQLTHNKKRINELQNVAKQIGCRLTRINHEIIERKYNKQAFMVLVLESDKARTLKDLQKTRKQLRQLAILQKAIKTSISLQAMEEAYLDAEYNNIGV